MLARTLPKPIPVRVLRVLVVDDRTEDAGRVRTLLLESGKFVAQSGRDLAEAEAMLRDGGCDVLLVSAELWADPGNPICRYVRTERGDIAVVLLADDADGPDTMAAVKLGAQDFLSRSHLDKHQLAARLTGAFEENRTMRRRETMVRWLEREARVDHLTGLHNRRAFDDQLHSLCTGHKDPRQPVTVIVANLVGTRLVNEVHGHEAGDDMIRRAGLAIAHCVRGGDFAARIAGDDFGIILPRAGLETGKLIARRIMHEVERRNGEDWADLVPVSLAFSVASGSGCDGEQLFAAADEHPGVTRPLGPVVRLFRGQDGPSGPSVA